MTLTRDSILFYQDWGRGRLDPIVGGAPTFLRAGGAWKFDGRLFLKVIRNQPRFEPVELNDGLRQAGLLLEPATEQELTAPFDFADAAWSVLGDVTRSDAESLFEGETASELTGGNAAASGRVVQDKGAFTGSSETAVFIHEQIDHPDFQVAIRDTTGAAWVTRYRVTFADLSVTLLDGTAAEQIEVIELLGDGQGPNGGKVVLVRLTDTGTGGNTGQARSDVLDAEQTSDSVVVHYIGWEENAYGSNPLDGPAGTSQAKDGHHYANAPRPQRMVWYARWVHGMPGAGGLTSPRVWDIGDSGTRLLVFLSGDDTVTALHSASSDAILGADLEPGDDVEAVLALAADGDVRALARVGGGSEADGGLTTGAGGLADEWSDPDLYVGQRKSGSQGRVTPVRLFAAKSADMDNDPETGAAADVMDELAQFFMTPAGEVV